MKGPPVRAWRRALPAITQGVGAVDGFAVHLKPFAQLQQALLGHLGNRSVRHGADVQQQVTVLGHAVHEVVDEVLGGLKARAFDVPPAP